MADIPIWILRDTDPYGGFFAAQSWAFDPKLERPSIVEVRVARIDADLWDFMLNQGGLPVDADGTHDSTWLEYWDDAEPYWLAPGETVPYDRPQSTEEATVETRE